LVEDVQAHKSFISAPTCDELTMPGPWSGVASSDLSISSRANFLVIYDVTLAD